MGIRDYIDKNCFPQKDDRFSSYIEYFKTSLPEIDAIILYGSCVNEKTKKITSYPDFYLLVPSYKGVFMKRKILNQILARILPPSSFFLLKENPHGPHLKAKYNIIKTEKFLREISDSPSDFYNLGRFGKKTIVLYFKDNSVKEKLLSALEKCFKLNVKYACGLLEGKYTLREIILHILSTSYSADYRVERDTKVFELFEAERDFYCYIYSRSLDELREKGEIKFSKEGEFYFFENNFFKRLFYRFFIIWGKIRSVLRWPKGILTFENYVDYLIDKIERAKGIRIELNEREKKFPLIFGWKYFFRLKKQGMIK